MSIRVRPELRFDTIDDVINDIRVLRRAGYEQHGNWSLPQIAWHVGKILQPTLKAPTIRSATPEQNARWNGFIAVIREPGGGSKFPAGANEPKDKCLDDDVEHLIALFQQLRDFPDTHLDTTVLGAQPLESVQEAHRLHAAHHLGFLRPKRRPPLDLRSIEDVIDEVVRLRRVGYTKTGNWSLEQASFHLSRTTPNPIQAYPPNPPPQPKPAVIERLKHYADHNAPLPGITAPPGSEPSSDVPADMIDYYLDGLQRVIEFNEPLVDFGERGPIPLDIYKGFIRGHAAHHLSFLVPHAERRNALQYASIDDALADIESLRKGYVQVGDWTLPQVAWHLNKTLLGRLQPPPFAPDTDEMRGRAGVLKTVLASGKIPRIIAPPHLQPPESASDADIDELLQNMRRAASHSGFSPHRLFGTMNDADSRRHILVHSAHHLSFLVPARGATK